MANDITQRAASYRRPRIGDTVAIKDDVEQYDDPADVEFITLGKLERVVGLEGEVAWRIPGQRAPFRVWNTLDALVVIER